MSAASSALGKNVKIDLSTGDINVHRISVEQVKDGKEVYLKPWPVG